MVSRKESRLLALLGPSDSGKTTLVQSLVGYTLKKYNRQRRMGITLKVCYGQAQIQGLDYYFLDNPGHRSLSLEALRNIDLMDLVLYVVDGSVVKNTKMYSYGLQYYGNISKTLMHLGVPFIMCINKAQTRTVQELTEIHRDYTKVCSSYLSCIPVSAKTPQGLVCLVQELRSIRTRDRNPPQGVLCRVLKSFNVNPTGVVLKQIKGGVLGCYNYRTAARPQDVCHTNALCNDLVPLTIQRQVDHNQYITTIETGMDPSLSKNDLQKGTLIMDYTKVDRRFLGNPSSLTLDIRDQQRTLVKGQKVHILALGQTLQYIFKKQSRNPRLQGLFTAVKTRGTRYLPPGTPAVVLGQNSGEHRALAWGQIHEVTP